MNTDFKLPGNFFKKNKLPQICAAELTYFKMTDLFEADKKGFSDYTLQTLASLKPSMIDDDKAEKEMIEKASTPEQLVDLLRKVKGMSSTGSLYRKIIEKQDETVPLVIEKYIRSSYDAFIESSAIVLGNCDPKYAKELWDRYDHIRAPYAKSTACLVIGKVFEKDSGMFLYDQFLTFKSDHPSDTFEEAPLLMLYDIYYK